MRPCALGSSGVHPSEIVFVVRPDFSDIGKLRELYLQHGTPGLGRRKSLRTRLGVAGRVACSRALSPSKHAIKHFTSIESSLRFSHKTESGWACAHPDSALISSLLAPVGDQTLPTRLSTSVVRPEALLDLEK